MLDAIGALYEAALDESLWRQALTRLMTATSSQASSFWVLDAVDLHHSSFITINFDPKAVQEYLHGMSRLDPTVRYLRGHPRESIVHDGMLVAGRDEDTRCYSDWHQRTVQTRHRIVGQSDPGIGFQAGVALHRTARAGRYSDEEVRGFALLNTHLRRALSVAAGIGSLHTLQQLSSGVLDRSSAAILLLDISGRVIFMNHAAESLQVRRDGVHLSAGGVRLADSKEDEQLKSHIARLRGPLRRSGRAGGEVMRASRPSGRAPYVLWLTSMPCPPAALSPSRTAICLVISDLERVAGTTIEPLQRLFRLTRAEARLALCLVRGETLRNAAEQLGITYGTARTRLTQLLQKTHSHSQSGLVRLLMLSTGIG
jgi:DNA-binding CsgD family transcriptional regulator